MDESLVGRGNAAPIAASGQGASGGSVDESGTASTRSSPLESMMGLLQHFVDMVEPHRTEPVSIWFGRCLQNEG